MRRHLDAAQAGVGKAREARLDQRRLAGAARAGQQRVIGRMARDKLRKVVEKLTLTRSMPSKPSASTRCRCAIA